jgi:threonine/homoserine/homoserine lactone efflux protein
MLDSTNLSVFFITAIVLTVTPGPDTLYVIARTLAQGRTAGVISVLGICLGLLVHISAATVGLSALLMTSALAYSLVKYAGAVYLIYLGIRMVLSRPHRASLQPSQPASLAKIFIQGTLSCLLNPKLALFFLAFLPQFVVPNQGNVAWQIFTLGAIFAMLGVSWLTLVALLTSYAGDWMRQRSGLLRFQQWFTGGILISLGIRLAVPEH